MPPLSLTSPSSNASTSLVSASAPGINLSGVTLDYASDYSAQPLSGRICVLKEIFGPSTYKVVLAFSSFFLFKRVFSGSYSIDVMSTSLIYKGALRQAFINEDGLSICAFWQRNAQMNVAFDLLLQAFSTRKFSMMQGLFSLPFFIISLEMLKAVDNTYYKLGLYKAFLDLPQNEAKLFVQSLKANPIQFSVLLNSFLPAHQMLIVSILEGSKVLDEAQYIELALAI